MFVDAMELQMFIIFGLIYNCKFYIIKRYELEISRIRWIFSLLTLYHHPNSKLWHNQSILSNIFGAWHLPLPHPSSSPFLLGTFHSCENPTPSTTTIGQPPSWSLTHAFYHGQSPSTTILNPPTIVNHSPLPQLSPSIDVVPLS